MNDIYDIIEENQETYTLKSGKLDEKLKELEINSLKRRSHEKRRFKFINKNRPESNENIPESNNDIPERLQGTTAKEEKEIKKRYRLINRNRNQKIHKRSIDISDSAEEKMNEVKKKKFKFINMNRPSMNERRSENVPNDDTVDEEGEISIVSSLVNHLCPVSNYYTINAYLSDDLVDKVKSLPNVIDVVKVGKLKFYSYETREVESNKYYDVEYIKKETGWKGVGVQEINEDNMNAFAHLSLMSQYKFNKNLTGEYDRNYYYPESAGKGIDIFLIDNGLWTNHEDFDTYEGTEDERTISCDANYFDGMLLEGADPNECNMDYDDVPIHGIGVSSAAGGTKYGVAKKANIHMLAVGPESFANILAAFDYVIQHGKPHKSVINISMGTWIDYVPAFQDKINDLVREGYLLFVAAGNDGEEGCQELVYGDFRFFNYFTMFENVIAVGALEKTANRTLDNMYSAASFSDFGDCVAIHAPGDAVLAYFKDSSDTKGYRILTGTSFSSPMVAGVAATLMSENPDIEFTQELMEKTLIELSIKGEIANLGSETTPNRIVNNGKRIVFSPVEVYNGCGTSSGNAGCSGESCCSKDGQCVDLYSKSNEVCLVENGCQGDFGTCVVDISSYLKKPTPQIEKGINCHTQILLDQSDGTHVQYESNDIIEDCILADLDIPDKEKANEINGILYCGRYSESVPKNFNEEITISSSIMNVEIKNVYAINFVSKDALNNSPAIQDNISYQSQNYPPLFKDDNSEEMMFINNEKYSEIKCKHKITSINSENLKELLKTCIYESHLAKLKAFFSIEDTSFITNPPLNDDSEKNGSSKIVNNKSIVTYLCLLISIIVIMH